VIFLLILIELMNVERKILCRKYQKSHKELSILFIKPRNI